MSESPSIPPNDPAAKGQKIDQHRNLANRLSESGYPAELRIGRTLADAGWAVEHVQYFQQASRNAGPVDDTWREIDIRATLTVGPAPSDAVLLRKRSLGTVRLDDQVEEASEVLQPTYVIECKQSKHEWVIFIPTAELTGKTDLHADSCFSPAGFGRDLVDFIRLSMEASPRAAELASLLDSLPFTPRGRIGHGIAAVSDAPNRDQGKNKAYKAVEGCVEAVEFFDRKHIEHIRSPSFTSRSRSPLGVAIHMPLVVLDGQLFTLEVDAEGREAFQPVPSAAVYFRGDGRAEGLVVPVVTTAALREFAEAARASWQRIGEFAASAGALPGQEKSMLRLLIEQTRPPDDEDRKDQSDDSSLEEPGV